MTIQQLEDKLSQEKDDSKKLHLMLEMAKVEMKVDLFKALKTLQKAKGITVSSVDSVITFDVLFELGEVYFRLKKYGKSFEILEEALQYVEPLSKNGLKAQKKQIKGQIVKGNFEKGKIDALALLEKIDDTIEKNVALYLNSIVAIAAFRLSDYQLSKKSALKAIEISETVNLIPRNQKEIAKSLEILGRLEVINGNYGAAEAYYAEAVEYSKADKTNHTTFAILNNFTHIYFEKGDLVKAFEKISEAEESIPTERKSYYQAFIYSNKADIYNLAGDFDKALEFNYRSLELMQEYSQSYYLVSRLSSIGQLLLKTNQKEKALEYLNEAKTLGNSINYTRFHNEINQSIGHYYLKNEDYKQAFIYFSTILENIRIVKNTGLLIRTLTALGKTFAAQIQFEKANEYFTEALELADKTESNYYKGDILNELGKLYLKTYTPQLAKGFLEQALTVNQMGNYKDLLESTHQTQYEWHKSQGDFEQALHHYQAFKSYEVEKLQQVNLQKVKQLELNIDLQKKEKEIQLLKQKENLLQLSNDSLSHFASVASHDMREPLRMIHQFAQLLKRRNSKNLDKRSLEYLNFILDGSNRMTSLIKNLLEFSQAGKLDKPPAKVDLNDVIRLVMMNLHVQIKDKSAIINATQLPTIHAHVSPIVQIFQNIISNGIKFQKPDNQPVISITTKETAQKQVVIIQDNGIGIEAKNLPKVFEIFNRFEARTNYEGNGIGLATAKKIIESYHGSITVESTIGEGTTFYVEFPK